MILRLTLASTFGRMPARTLENAEKCRNKEERRNRREKQSTNDRAAKRSVLFTAVPQSQSHWHHADDHCESSHQHGPKTRETRFQCGAHGITSLIHFFRSKAHNQYAV